MKNYYKLSPTPANARMLVQLNKHNVSTILDDKIIELSKQDLIEDFSEAEFEVDDRSKKIIQEMVDNNMRFFIEPSNEDLIKKMVTFCAKQLNTNIYQYNTNLADVRLQHQWGFPSVTADDLLRDSFISENRKSIIFLTFTESSGYLLSSDIFYLYERIVFCGRGMPQLDNNKLPYFNVLKPTQENGFVNAGQFAAPFLRRRIHI